MKNFASTDSSGRSALAPDLEQTRAALREFMTGNRVPGDSGDDQAPAAMSRRNDDGPVGGQRSEPPNAISIAGAAITAWWQQNPLAVLPKIAQPLIAGEVRKHPWQAVALSAAAGAAVVWLRPWRHLPAASLVQTLIRTTSTSALTAAVLAALQESMNNENDTRAP